MKTLSCLAIVFSLTFSGKLNAQPNDLLTIWRSFIENNYEKTLDLCNNHLKRDTTNYQLYLIKGKTLEKLYRYGEGIAMLERANNLQKNNVEILSALAGLYMVSGQAAKAISIYDDLGVLEPTNTTWRMNCALALQTEGRVKEAIQELGAIVILDSANWMAYKSLGDCLVRINNLKGAAQWYKAALKYYPQNAALAAQLAGVYIKLEKPTSAINVAKQAISYDSTFREGLRWLGIGYYTAQYRDSSLNIFERLWDLGDTSAMVNRYLGMLYYQNAGNSFPPLLDEVYIKSETHLRNALIADPQNIDLLFTLGSVCGLNKKPLEGLQILDTLNNILQKYEVMKAYNEAEKGKLYREAKLYDNAVQSFRKALTILPDKSAYMYEIAVSYDYADKKKQAIEWYKRFMSKQDPDWEKTSMSGQRKNVYETIAIGRIKKLYDELFLDDKD